MIKFAQENFKDVEALKSYSNTDCFAVKILALLKAYGATQSFLHFYFQESEGGVSAIMAQLDGDLTLSYSAEADVEELVDFTLNLGFTSLLCNADFPLYEPFDEGVIMATGKKPQTVKKYKFTEPQTHDELLEFFKFSDYGAMNFDAFYVDLNHRLRHGTAKTLELKFNGEIASVGLLSSVYNDDAIISAVKTDERTRGMGYGTALVGELMNKVHGTVFVMREENKNESFYKNLHFENIGRWRIYT